MCVFFITIKIKQIGIPIVSQQHQSLGCHARMPVYKSQNLINLICIIRVARHQTLYIEVLHAINVDWRQSSNSDAPFHVPDRRWD